MYRKQNMQWTRKDQSNKKVLEDCMWTENDHFCLIWDKFCLPPKKKLIIIIINKNGGVKTKQCLSVVSCLCLQKYGIWILHCHIFTISTAMEDSESTLVSILLERNWDRGGQTSYFLLKSSRSNLFGDVAIKFKSKTQNTYFHIIMVPNQFNWFFADCWVGRTSDASDSSVGTVQEPPNTCGLFWGHVFIVQMAHSMH